MKLSESMYQRSLKVAPGGVHSPVRAFKSVGGNPLFFRYAEGAYLTSVDEVRYIDYCQSFGPNILGHRDAEVQEEVHRAVNTAWSFGACEPYSLELAEWIVEHVPWIEKVRFVNSGTEAVMSALRLARAATGRSKILKFEGCYHGHVDQMLVKAGSGLAGEAASSSAGVSHQLAEQTLVAKLDDEASVEKIFNQYGAEIAAIIIEPLPANYGLLVQRQEFLIFLRDICKKHGSLLIFDEVISGFRIGMGGMAETTGITPDLVTYGKVIGGGFPVGCYAAKAKLMDMMAPEGQVYQAGTLSASPIGMRAGLATLKKVKRENVFAVLEKRTEKFASRLNEIFQKAGSPFKVCHQGSVFWMHTGFAPFIRSLEELPPRLGEDYKNLFHRLLNAGVYLAPSGYEVGFLSYAHDEEILSKTLAAFEKALTR